MVMRAREVYQKTQKAEDVFWNRFVCRPIAALIVSRIEARAVTPNQVTLASFVVGAASAVLLVVLPGHAGLIAAVLVYQFSYVLDCADGMLARLRATASSAGHLLDFLMDEIKAFLVLGAAAVRLAREADDERYLLVGLGGLVALASGIALTSFLRHPAIALPAPPKSAAARLSLLARIVRFVESCAKFVIHYPSYLLYVAFMGRLELYLLPYVAVNALYAARTLTQVARRFGQAAAAS